MDTEWRRSQYLRVGVHIHEMMDEKRNRKSHHAIERSPLVSSSALQHKKANVIQSKASRASDDVSVHA